jgi:hypothetical protein
MLKNASQQGGTTKGKVRLEWEKISANHISDKELIPKTIRNSKLSSKKKKK